MSVEHPGADGDTEPMNRLLVLRLSALGDVIHTMPAVLALRDSFPGKVLWAVEAPYRELVEIVSGVETIPVRLKAWGRSPIASRNAIRNALRAMRAETSIDFQGLVKSATLGVLSGARVRVGFHGDAIKEKAALLFTNRRVKVDISLHVVEQNLQLARHLSPGASPAAGDWSSFGADPGNRLAGLEGSIVLLPGAGKPNKIWPHERFGELARRLGPRAVVAWGPGERDLAASTGARIAPATDLRELAWLLQHAAVVIGGDTGPLHLAAALGTKVIGLYGPTDSLRTGPYGQLDRCISHFHTTKLMESISVEEVMNHLAGASAT